VRVLHSQIGRNVVPESLSKGVLVILPEPFVFGKDGIVSIFRQTATHEVAMKGEKQRVFLFRNIKLLFQSSQVVQVDCVPIFAD